MVANFEGSLKLAPSLKSTDEHLGSSSNACTDSSQNASNKEFNPPFFGHYSSTASLLKTPSSVRIASLAMQRNYKIPKVFNNIVRNRQGGDCTV